MGGPIFKIGLEVVLEDVGRQKIAVIKAIRELLNLGLKEAKDLVESTPQTLMTQVTLDNASRVKQELENMGAQVTIR